MVSKKTRDMREVKHGLTKVKSGVYVGGCNLKEELPATLRLFGCLKCSWIGTESCPHGKLVGQTHTNGICSQRVKYLKSELVKVGNVPRMIQNEMAIQLKMLTDRMLLDYSESGELHEEFKHLNKNLISLIDKMRKQDEGLKIQGEITVAHEDFRKMVEIEAKKIEEKNNRTRPAEFTEEV